MPRLRLSEKFQTKPISIRLPVEDEAVLRQHARMRGVSLSAYIAKTLSAQIVSENIKDIEDRLRALIREI